ncbi:MAG: spore germination protein, partial [Evtepia sp.]
SILSGTLCLLIEGFATAFLIDARTYPARGITEPEDSRVLRGSRDGFVETLIFNTALIRRRMRDPGLTMELVQIGKKSKTDVVLCYLAPLADPKTLQEIRTRVAKIDVNTLTLSQESLAECIAKTQWYNPFPNIRYTERPDVASANIAEGKIIVLVDNSPAVMIIPTTFFDFVQDINDFYFPPLIGTYLRLVRTVVFFITLFLTPVWLLLMQNPDWLPQSLIFLRIEDAYHVPLLVQLLIFEFVIDGLKLASLNTPSALSNSFSVVGALILGEFAVRSGWFVPDTVLYMAFVAIANFAQPSFELGYAFKLSRIVLLCGTAAFQAWGLLGATILIFVVLGTTRTVSGKSYLYPLIPWNGRALKNLLIRRRISRENTTT